jgi:hypothetical protein
MEALCSSIAPNEVVHRDGIIALHKPIDATEDPDARLIAADAR